MAAAYKRRNYFIKKGFQTRFMIPFLLSSLLANIIAVTLFIIPARSRIDTLLFSMQLPNTDPGALLTPLALLAGVAAVAAVSLLLLWSSRKLYHTISDSLRQIRSDLQKMTAGDLSCRVTMRERDEFHDFAEEINAMTCELNGGIMRLKELAREVTEAAGGLKVSPDSAEYRASRETMMRAIRSMQEGIGAFKI